MPANAVSTCRADPRVHAWIRRELAADPPRAPSLIVTVWGDSIAPHGGAAMLAGVIALLASFGINERLVRTSVFRLARDGWLRTVPIGRRSLYRLTQSGARRFEQASRRIYAPSVEQWDGTWELVIACGVTAAQRRALALELGWDGFASFASGVHARPARSPSALARIAAALDLADRLVVARAHDDAELGARTLASVAPSAWDVRGVAVAYRRFLLRFGGVIERFREAPAGEPNPEQAFVVRTLLIHAFRRVLLRDPQLPASLLPLDWPGAAAYALARDFYRLTHRAAERHLAATLADAGGKLPPALPWFYERFGGLSD